jgi:hypothetical protein
MNAEIKEAFSQLDIITQRNFLLHPDISSLLQDISLHTSDASKQKFLIELEYLCNQRRSLLTSEHGEYIPGTSIKLTIVDNNPANKIVGHPDHDAEGMIGW